MTRAKEQDGWLWCCLGDREHKRRIVDCHLLQAALVPRYTVLRLMIRQRLEEIAETPETI